ncbi:AMP-dependent synthetase/ligase [Mycobacterium syngnathidarum]
MNTTSASRDTAVGDILHGDGNHQEPPTSMVHAFHRTVKRLGDAVAIRGPESELTWNELRDRAELVAKGLSGLGVEPGDTVALLLSNRPEFHVLDIGAMLLNAVPFSIYPTLAPAQMRHLLIDSGARVVITEAAFEQSLHDAREPLEDPPTVVVIDSDKAGPMTLRDLETLGGTTAVDLAVIADSIDGDSVLTLIYTSGTTGPSKGVELVHRNALAFIAATLSRIPFPPHSKVISWLPAAHIAERAAHHYLPMAFGVEITTCADIRQIGGYLQQVEPTWFFAVPRIWEKLKAALESAIAEMGDQQADSVMSAIGASRERVRAEQSGTALPPARLRELEAFEHEIFAPLRRRLGFGGLVAAHVGSAPMAVDVIEFYHAIGVPLAELYGMSETFGVGTSNPLERIKIGTVGTPAPGVEVAIADDGEILLRSDAVMRGYRNRPDKTAEAIFDGWYHTGDIGILDDDGYLSVVDRKDDMIINAAGKNMSPASIESAVKTQSPLVAQICVIGDRRPYNTALIVLDPEAAAEWARRHGAQDAGVGALAHDDTVRAELEACVARANQELSRPEQIKKFCVLPMDWAAAGDELTPTNKLKRKAIAEKYAEQIDALYG